MTTAHATSRPASRDYSGAGIVFSNLLVIVYALVEGWHIGTMLGIYWAQSVVIGFYQVLRILRLRSFSTEGFTSNGKPVPENEQGKRGTAIFFVFHYGFFHLAYLAFLATAAKAGGGDLLWWVLSVLGFVLGHGISFVRNVRADLSRRPNLGTLMFLPYARIVPMHLTILLGSQLDSGPPTLLLFCGLKTAADYLMHIVEHRVLQRAPEVVPENGAAPPRP